MALDAAASRAAIAAHVGEPLGLADQLAAWGIHDSVNESMAAATKMYAAERGVDTSALSLIASGGAGPVHCYGLARKLGIREIIIPPAVGVASAVGFLAAPVSFDLVQTHKTPLVDAELTVVGSLFETMEREARETMAQAGEPDVSTFERSFDIRYVGQGYEVNVQVPTGGAEWIDKAALLRLFKKTYENLFGRAFPENEFEIVNLRLIARGPYPESPLRPREPNGGDVLKGTRMAYCPETAEFTEHRVYDRYALDVGATIAGPAIVEERESTSVIGRSGRARVDEFGLLRIELGGV
jgi:N-methylhydantoinase A